MTAPSQAVERKPAQVWAAGDRVADLCGELRRYFDGGPLSTNSDLYLLLVEVEQQLSDQSHSHRGNPRSELPQEGERPATGAPAVETITEAGSALTARVRELEAALKVARDYVYDYGSEASMAPVVAQIDAALAGGAP